MRKGSGTPLAARNLVIESGVRDETSPFHATGVGPIAHSRSDGAFESWFVTAGTDGHATVPQFVDVFLEVDEGKWAPLRVPLTESSGSQGSDAGLALDLGAIEVDEKERLAIARPATTFNVDGIQPALHRHGPSFSRTAVSIPYRCRWVGS